MWNWYYYFDLPKIRFGQASTKKIKLPSPYMQVKAITDKHFSTMNSNHKTGTPCKTGQF